jgi:hypothetical protein
MYFYDASGFLQATVLLYILLGCAGSLLWLPVSSRRSVTSEGDKSHNGHHPPRPPQVAAGVA